eukprot:TRINITY_DN7513_c1_g5_i1.p1 TRINITY_DN7513_c1_g5~~TRINITY_DN7513_c1_g5_i1.p1  ORF type:complete len:323 (-),score=59.75 TRINITY_DN7513_c1_g5_i1:363-1331(-)
MAMKGNALLSRGIKLATVGMSPVPQLLSTSSRALPFELGRRNFGSTDGPFLLKKPKFKDKKKHYGEVLVMADRRKLLETIQDVIDSPSTRYPDAFWQILAKRSIQSAHLLRPLELAIIAKAFHLHSPKLHRDLDVYPHIASQVRTATSVPGLAVIVFAEILPQRLRVAQDEITQLMQTLGRRAADVMWEIPVGHAIRILQALSVAGVQDRALCSRIAQKVSVQLESFPISLDEDEEKSSQSLKPEDLGRAASSFASQGHRDLELFKGLAGALSKLISDRSAVTGRTATEEASGKLLESLDMLGIDDLEEAEPLRQALKFSSP